MSVGRVGLLPAFGSHRVSGLPRENDEVTVALAPPKVSGKHLGRICYRDLAHESAPHVASFSGGRSSAALAFMAASDGVLRPERGDVVLFANTSAEHPGTYEFAARCKEELESEFGLPCFWFEFCTLETEGRQASRSSA